MSQDSTEQIPTSDPAHELTELTPRTEHPMDSTTLFPATSAEPTSAGEEQPARPPRIIRVGTVVWGLVVAAVGLGLIALASGLTFDVELAVILLLVAAGLALVVGSLATGLRHRRR